MSGEKCGTPFGVVVEVPSVKIVEEESPIRFTSGNAFRVLKKIRHKYPEFDPSTEAEIYVKARAMGITEEE
jgi:hypothetical protein